MTNSEANQCSDTTISHGGLGPSRTFQFMKLEESLDRGDLEAAAYHLSRLRALGVSVAFDQFNVTARIWPGGDE